jgi:hypothetical protein
MKAKFIILVLFVLSSFSLLASDFGGGDGSSTTPYLIVSVKHLNNVRNFPDKYFFTNSPC